MSELERIRAERIKLEKENDDLIKKIVQQATDLNKEVQRMKNQMLGK